MYSPIISSDTMGSKIYLYPDDNLSYSKDSGYFNDDPNLIKYLYKKIKPGWTVFDVGAMRGYISIVAGNPVGKKGEVHAFEPESKNYQRLSENISLNELNNITANKNAVYDKITAAKLNVFQE